MSNTLLLTHILLKLGGTGNKVQDIQAIRVVDNALSSTKGEGSKIPL